MPKVQPLKPKRSFSEVGVTGLTQYSGYVQEEFLRDLQGLRWRKTVREMLSNDSMISAMFFAVEYLCRQVTWDVLPATDSEDAEEMEAAEFVQSCLDDMSHSWNDAIAEILSFLPWGWSYFEIVYKRRRGEATNPGLSSKHDDNKIGWRKWAIRAQDSLLKWEFDEGGGVQAMIQQAAPHYRDIAIPIEKSLLFRTSTHKNNPEGRSLLRSAYRSWYFKKNIENYEAIGIERDLAGLPLMRIPAEYMVADADANKKSIKEECQRIVTTVRADEQGGLLIPSDPFTGTNVPMFEFKLVSSAGAKRVNTREVIAGKNQEILMTLMADFLMIGHQKVGSLALMTSKTDLFNTALGSFLDTIAETINRHAIPRLLRLNGIPVAQAPRLTHGDIKNVDLAVLAEFIAKTAGVLRPEEIEYLLGEAGLPKREEDPDEEEDEEEDEENVNPEPVVSDDEDETA